MINKNEPRTQSDIVKKQLGDHASTRMTSVTEKVRPPGIEKLHLQSKEDIAIALANVLKSRANITGLNYIIGQYIEITSETNQTLD